MVLDNDCERREILLQCTSRSMVGSNHFSLMGLFLCRSLRIWQWGSNPFPVLKTDLSCCVFLLCFMDLSADNRQPHVVFYTLCVLFCSGRICWVKMVKYGSRWSFTLSNCKWLNGIFVCFVYALICMWVSVFFLCRMFVAERTHQPHSRLTGKWFITVDGPKQETHLFKVLWQKIWILWCWITDTLCVLWATSNNNKYIK